MKKLFIALLSILVLNCSKGNLSQAEITQIIQKHYDKDPFFKDSKVKAKLIKEFTPNHKAVLVHINDNTFSCGFINEQSKKYVVFSEFEEQENKITMGSNWNVQLPKIKNGITTKENDYFSVCYGIIPNKRFKEIEISWNCNKVEKTTLIDGTYFFFAYPKQNVKRCNKIFLIDRNLKRTEVEYRNNIESGFILN